MKLIGALTVLLLAVSAWGCDAGQAPCDEATSRLSACLWLDGIDSMPPSDTANYVCEGVSLCNARCIDDLDDFCAILKDHYSGMQTVLSQPFRDCLAACQTP